MNTKTTRISESQLNSQFAFCADRMERISSTVLGFPVLTPIGSDRAADR